VSPRTRLAVIALVLLAILAAVGLLAFAAHACPSDTALRPCPSATTNRVIVLALVVLTVALLVTPFAFLAEFAARRRIVYRGAWARAVRRAVLLAAVAACLAGLRLGGALSPPTGLFIVTLAGAVEWLAIRRFDLP
jgi:hypothetical protein